MYADPEGEVVGGDVKKMTRKEGIRWRWRVMMSLAFLSSGLMILSSFLGSTPSHVSNALTQEDLW